MRDWVVRVVLVVWAAASVQLGIWATFAPRSFYEKFPGFGHHWVSMAGPYDEHLVRDVGGLYLALLIMPIMMLGMIIGAGVSVTLAEAISRACS